MESIKLTPENQEMPHRCGDQHWYVPEQNPTEIWPMPNCWPLLATFPLDSSRFHIWFSYVKFIFTICLLVVQFPTWVRIIFWSTSETDDVAVLSSCRTIDLLHWIPLNGTRLTFCNSVEHKSFWIPTFFHRNCFLNCFKRLIMTYPIFD